MPERKDSNEPEQTEEKFPSNEDLEDTQEHFPGAIDEATKHEEHTELLGDSFSGDKGKCASIFSFNLR